MSGTENDFAERIEVCLRAQLLDDVMDPLADYVEARAIPSKQAAINSSSGSDTRKRWKNTGPSGVNEHLLVTHENLEPYLE